jgi:microcompartment protein CcmK/EutM
MRLGKVVGQVVATRKDAKLEGVRLLIVQPLNDDKTPHGLPLVAADGMSSRDGQIVFYVNAREASVAIAGRIIPSDCSIVGIVDAVEA